MSCARSRLLLSALKVSFATLAAAHALTARAEGPVQGTTPKANSGERPDEGALFGGANTQPPIGPTSAGPTSTGPTQDALNRDTEELKPSESKRDAFKSGEVSDNPLQIGGLYYQRMIISGQKGAGAKNAPFSLPLEFDGFLDSRPSDRVRGFVDGRLYYDASRDSNSRTNSRNGSANLQSSSTSAAPTSVPGASNSGNSSNPQVGLDQAWLKFDIERTVFITAGKQHVKWGTSRFWNPTDLLSSQRRDPLLPYDLRLGNSMLKFDLPLESQKGSINGIVLLDNPVSASTLSQVGGAFRAETVVGNAEIGFDFIARSARAPVYGADLSAPFGPFDIYLEAALLTQAPGSGLQFASAPTLGTDLSSVVTPVQRTGAFAQVSGGANYTFGWRDNRQATFGLEYFYNQLGYDDAHVYPALILFGQYQPFYTGKNYGAFYLTAEGPDSQKHTSYSLSTLGNLSDHSFISRLDFTWRLLTYLTFESYVDVHYGTEGGEFNFSVNTPALTYQGVPVAAVSIPPTLYDLGAGLRLSF